MVRSLFSLVRGALILFGVGLLALANYTYLAREAPGVIIDEPDREVLGCSPGLASVVGFRVYNRNRHPVQVIGIVEC
jgi:hypothetical protein